MEKRTYIFEKNERGCDDNTYEWTAEGIQPEIDNLQNVPEVCENWYRIFRRRSMLSTGSGRYKDNDPLQYDNLKTGHPLDCGYYRYLMKVRSLLSMV